MLVKYLKHSKGFYATIVATDRDKIGVALCCEKDQFDKHLGKTIAQGRATKGKMPNIPHKEFVVSQEMKEGDEPIKVNRKWGLVSGRFSRIKTLDEILDDEIEIMRDRARRYFKE